MAHRILRIVALAALTLALTAAAAYASARFASPTGTSADPCTQASPCDIVTAVNSAANNADITIEPGTYNISTVLSDGGNFLTIHGQAGAARPVIKTDADYGIQLTGGSSLSDVEVDDPAAGAWGIAVMFGMEATVSHVYVHTTGSNAWACYPDGELIDSVCWDSGPGGGAARPLVVLPAMVVAINDTLIASGTGGVGAEVIGGGPANMTMSLTNTIVRGAGKDIYVTGEETSPGLLTITADHSNYANGEDDATGSGTSMFTPAGSGTNQTAMPRFVDAAAGNFHELAGSPTIGKGATNAVAGETDLDGLPWTLPPDIGAYQFYNGPSCNAASASTKFGTAAVVHLQCSDSLADPVTLAIASGPKHGTLSAIGSGGSVTYTPNAGYSGADSFTYTGTSKLGTSAPATVSITVATKSGAKKPGGKKVAPVISHAKQSKGVFTFTLNEPATVTLTFKLRGHVRGTLKIAAKGGKSTVRVKGRLSKHHKLKAGAYVVTLTASNSAGHSKSVKVKYKLAARR
jgi:Bacterial Ig domain